MCVTVGFLCASDYVPPIQRATSLTFKDGRRRLACASSHIATWKNPIDESSISGLVLGSGS